MRICLILVFFFACSVFGAQPHWQEMPPVNDAAKEKQPVTLVPIHASSNLARPRSQEIHIHIEEPKDRTNTPAASSEDTEDTIPKHRHNRRMIVSNSVSALIATLITAGVTLTVHFTSCKK